MDGSTNDEDLEEEVTFNSEDGDETVTLSEIVAGREVTLREEELWALCRECCLTLEFVHSTQELFQSLVITPETVAFDREGNVCFLDLDADPEQLYIPPEYVEDGCSYKFAQQSRPEFSGDGEGRSHLYSLGMTLLFAVESSGSPDDEDAGPLFSDDLTGLLTHLTQDHPDNRPDLELVLEYCDRALQDTSSQDVCQRFACGAGEQGHDLEGGGPEEGTSLQLMTEELAAYLHNQTGLVAPVQRTSNNTGDADAGKQASRSKQQAWPPETQVASSQQSTVEAKEEIHPKKHPESSSSKSRSPIMDVTLDSARDDGSISSPRKGRRRQGMLLSDILLSLSRFLQEPELWALCRECIISLQRKKKHLPAYISPDTVMVREIGSVSFKAIPEDKPLEVVYMAPELQQKGILNEKTCLFGLGVTLRSAAGQKQGEGSSELDAAVGPAFQQLMATLLDANPDYRPSLEMALMACDEFDKQSSIESRLLCQEMYMDATALMSSREPNKRHHSSVDQEMDSIHMAAETSWPQPDDTDKEAVFLDDRADEETETPYTKSSAFQSVSSKQPPAATAVTGSAFKPVALRAKPAASGGGGGGGGGGGEGGSQHLYPSAFHSPATHFKPIVLQTSASVSEPPPEESGGQEDNDRDKNVVRKLREIKKNLLKHRPPDSLTRDLEAHHHHAKPPAAGGDKPPVGGDTPKTPRTSGSSSRRSSGSGSVGVGVGALESFLQQLQSSGQMPDTQNLALAIAQHLQTQMGPAVGALQMGPAVGALQQGGVGEGGQPFLPAALQPNQQPSDAASRLRPSPEDAQLPAPAVPSQTSSLGAQLSPPGNNVTVSQAASSETQPGSQALPSAVAPGSQWAGPVTVSQAGFVGQGVPPVGHGVPSLGPMPVLPLGGGVIPGPVQYQLQQDPRTGLVQLVPVPVMSLGSQPGPPHSPRTPSSDHAYIPWQHAVSPGATGQLFQEGSADNDATGFQNAGRSSSVKTRNARGLIQKTAGHRVKNAAASASTSPTGYLPAGNLPTGYLPTGYLPAGNLPAGYLPAGYPPESDPSLAKVYPYYDDMCNPSAAVRPGSNSQYRRSNSVGAMMHESGGSDGCDAAGVRQGENPLVPPRMDYSVTSFKEDRSINPINNPRQGSVHSSAGVAPPVFLRSVSQSSSPSPSKDSGICVTGGGSVAPPGGSLMERLLSSESLRHQHAVTQVLHLLNQGFGTQGPHTFHSEEMLAEYVVSLAHLKLETFMRAVTEKYSDLFWSHSLLVNLYHTVNGPANPVKAPAQTPPASRWRAAPPGDQEVLHPAHTAHSAAQAPRSSELEGRGRQPHLSAHSSSQHSHGDSQQQQRRPEGAGRPPAASEGPGSGASHSAVRVLPNGTYVSENSDSTDTEGEEKRRRFKKRYELDRGKSSSLQGLPGAQQYSLPPEQAGFQPVLHHSPPGGGGTPLDHRQARGSEHSYDVRLPVNARADTRDGDVTVGTGGQRRGEGDSAGGRGDSRRHPEGNWASSHVKTSSGYHSLPRAAKPSQPPPPPPTQAPHSQNSRDAVSASWSNGGAGLNASYPGVAGRGWPRADSTVVSPSSSSSASHRGHSGASPHQSLSPLNYSPASDGLHGDGARQQRGEVGSYRDALSPHHQRPDSRFSHSQQQQQQQQRPDSQSSHRQFRDSPGQSQQQRSDQQQARLDSQYPAHHQQRPDSRGGPHRQYRDSPGNQPPPPPAPAPAQSRGNNPNLNVSGGSYSPALSQSSSVRENGWGEPGGGGWGDRSSSRQREAPHGFVYGQHREPLGKPPPTTTTTTNNNNNNNTITATSPQPRKNLHNNLHSPPNFHNNSPGDADSHGRASVPLRGSPGRPEVNNNSDRKWPERGREARSQGGSGSGSGSAKNRERSPVRRTQHKARPQLAWDQEIAEYRKKGQVVYHSAMIQLSMTPQVDQFILAIDEDNKGSLESKLASVEQELSVQRRQRRKSQSFYKKLTEPGAKQHKGEKSVVSQVLKDMSEMTAQLRFLELCRTHLQMLLTELYGLDTCFLASLVTGGGGPSGGLAGGPPQPLALQPCLENPFLQFQTVRQSGTGCEVQVLQAGHPQGLLAYLFALSAMSDGFIHQFLFCFRYFVASEDLFSFITHKYLSAKKGNQTDARVVQTQQRAMDLLQFWVEGFYTLDFERNEPLLDLLEAFIMQRVEEDREGSQNLMNLLYACHLGENTELVTQADDSEDLDEVYYLHLASPKRWESFRSLMGGKKWESFGKPAGGKEGAGGARGDKGGVVVARRPPSRAEEGSTASLSRRTDATQLMDYPPHRLAEQLTLMEQDLFQRAHPVHYLDSKAQGVGVDMSVPSLRTPSMARKSNPGAQSLFVSAGHFQSRVSDMIIHSQEITHWVSAEVLCCGSQKSQVSALSRFLTTAQLCVEIRNYATALAITAGLDNLLVRQLPAWKHLPAKSAGLMEDLEALQVRVKGETMALMQDKDSHLYPTVPCALYFLLQLQQLEIGGFTLANGMYKWQKMRSICQMIDQIRIFREHEYGFDPDYELQSLVCRRLHELSDRDLHTVAAAHDNNFRRVVSNTAGIQGTWRKVKVKLQSRSK